MTNNIWVIIVVASRYWYNYRHESNGFLIYNVSRSLNVPDERVIFMDAIDVLHSPRNPYRGQMHYDHEVTEHNNLLSSNVMEIDYRGEEVTIDSFKHVLLSNERFISPTLMSDKDSNVFLYLAGHGGDEFFKFHDVQELDAFEFGSIVNNLHQQGKYKQLFIVIDTCQAGTMGRYITAPNVSFLASSRVNENSYSLHMNTDLGVATVDRFTYFFHQFLSNPRRRSYSLSTLMSSLTPSSLYSNLELIQTEGAGDFDLLEFFRASDKDHLSKDKNARDKLELLADFFALDA